MLVGPFWYPVLIDQQRGHETTHYDDLFDVVAQLGCHVKAGFANKVDLLPVVLVCRCWFFRHSYPRSTVHDGCTRLLPWPFQGGQTDLNTPGQDERNGGPQPAWNLEIRPYPLE